MTRRLLISASILALTAGCSSSSSSGNNNATDSGTVTQTDSSMEGDSSTPPEDGGTDSGSPTGDTGVVSTGDSGTGEAGAPCVALTTVTAPTYTNVTAQSACTGAQITAFLAACSGASATQTTCATWSAANASCNACIAPAPDSGTGENGGALLFDSAGQAYINTPGCLQIKDGNTNCAAPLEELWLCEDDACDSVACQMASSTDQQACNTAADSTACMNEATAANNAAQCNTDFGDGGSATFCNPQTTAAFAGVIAAICDANGM